MGKNIQHVLEIRGHSRGLGGLRRGRGIIRVSSRHGNNRRGSPLGRSRRGSRLRGGRCAALRFESLPRPKGRPKGTVILDMFVTASQ